MTQAEAALTEALLDADTCWALVERTAASSYFKRTTRLRDLLLFIGRRQLREQCSQLHEQEIGVEVFGRPASYDTNVDNIVRANVSELRKRIETYFEGEGRTEPLLMEIPRGSYRLVFRKRVVEVVEPVPAPAADPSDAPASVSQAESTPAARAPWPLNFAALAVIFVLCGACVALWVSNRSMREELTALDRSLYPWREEPAVAAFWSAFLNSSQDTDVVVPDAALGQMEYYTQTSVSLRDYLDRSYLGQLQRAPMNAGVRDALRSFTSLNFVTLSAIEMADRIMALDPLSKKLHLYFSREYIPSFIDRDNVILLGDPVSNPFIQIIEGRLNFTVDRQGNHLGPVINHAPAGREQPVYVSTDNTGYCVVAYLPNTGHSGKFLLIQGTSPAATQAAEFFLLSEPQMAALKQKLSGQNSPYFEVLLRISQVTGTPLAASIEAYRVHADQ